MSSPASLRFVLGDQLSRTVSSLADAEPGKDIVLMAEVAEEATHVRHHKKKIAFLFSAMRHFAEDLRAEGFTVEYLRLDAPGTPRTFGAVLQAAVLRHTPDRVILTEPSEYRVLQAARKWQEEIGAALEIRSDDRFLASHEEFRAWALGPKGRQPKTLRMEFFYREMRRRTGYLMDGDAPTGGHWNFDHDNRGTMPDSVIPPVRPSFPPDALTLEVLTLVEARFGDHFGVLDSFDYPVTRADALAYLDWFVQSALPHFGDYQDAMRAGAPLMFHSHLSALINCGLLDPRECCARAEIAFARGEAPLNAAEGFIRQIIGWREFIRGVYWLKMPDYGMANALGADRPLPDFFWTAQTRLNCLHHAIAETRDNAYAHHIQRLMVIGNFCLLAGIDPKSVQDWFLIVYFDAYEWVEMPNVVGMALYADGGFLASKPYAASGAYIDRMSDYCGGCAFDVKAKSGPKACPFNYLYWDFLDRNQDALKSNHRVGMIMASLRKMTPQRLGEIRADARHFLDAL